MLGGLRPLLMVGQKGANDAWREARPCAISRRAQWQCALRRCYFTGLHSNPQGPRISLL
jgi:hypothetical protein